MKKRTIYKIATVILIVLILILVGWYWFIARESKALFSTKETNQSEQIKIGGGTGKSSVFGHFATNFDTNDPIIKDAEIKRESLRQIYNKPIAGITINKNGVILFVDRENGNIFKTNTDNLKLKRISNITIPRVHEAVFTNDGEGVIMRYLDGDKIVSIFMNTTQSEGSRDGVFLPDNITHVSASPNGKQIFYTIPDTIGVRGILANSDGTNKKTIWSSPLSDWNHSWGVSQNILLSQKTSQDTVGYAYTLTPSGVVHKLLNATKGLSIQNSNAGTYLYSTYVGDIVQSFIFNSKNTSVRPILESTLSDKCSTITDSTVYCAVPNIFYDGIYPDDWYNGTISFSDTLLKIDTTTGAGDEIAAPERTHSIPMDILNLFTDSNDEYLLFTNKKDLTPWILTLE